MSTTQADLNALRTRIKGDVVLPEEEAFAAARLAWNLSVDQRPVAVVSPESADDMVEIVRFAGENGLRVAFNGGGHNAGPITWDDHALLVKTSRMRKVDIDPVARRARVEAGVLADELATAAGEHGLAYLAGTSPDVGVVGYMLGGGISWLARKHGLATNSVTALDVVTADGRLVHTDADNEPDLFWAIRGGGGNFAAVVGARVPALRAARGLRRLLLLADRARDRDPERVACLGRHGARGVHLARPAAQASRPAVHPRPPQGARLRDGGARVHRQRGRRRRARTAVPRPRAGVRHGRPAADLAAQHREHGPRRAGAVLRRGNSPERLRFGLHRQARRGDRRHAADACGGAPPRRCGRTVGCRSRRARQDRCAVHDARRSGSRWTRR